MDYKCPKLRMTVRYEMMQQVRLPLQHPAITTIHQSSLFFQATLTPSARAGCRICGGFICRRSASSQRSTHMGCVLFGEMDTAEKPANKRSIML